MMHRSNSSGPDERAADDAWSAGHPSPIFNIICVIIAEHSRHVPMYTQRPKKVHHTAIGGGSRASDLHTSWCRTGSIYI